MARRNTTKTRRMRTEEDREHFPRHFIQSHDRRTWRRDCSLYPERTGSPLAGRVDVHLLSGHRPRLLVALYVLAGRTGRWWTDSPLLASLVWAGVRGLGGLGVQDLEQ